MGCLDSSQKTVLIVCLLLIITFTAAFGKQAVSYPPEIAQVLDSAGNNRIELEKVLSHYAAVGDSLKLKAANFLIANMQGHSYASFVLMDSSKNEIPFNVLDYPNLETLEKAFDTLESKHGSLDFKVTKLVRDIDTIRADFLIKQVDYAFRAWREKPWAKKLSFDDFCNYVLPYRGSNEPLEDWREYFWEKYKDIQSRISDSTGPVAAARLINDDIMSWFTFNDRYYYHPTDQSLSEMLQNKMGRCEDMTNITIYAMRANGLAVTSDYTPAWANAGGNHAWNSILISGAKVIPFMGAERAPGDYSLQYKPAKVYRKMFSEQKNNLVFQPRKQPKIPGWLAGKNYIDVTSDYVPVQHTTVTFEKEVPDSVDIAYLCVFNSGEWRPVAWARIENDHAIKSAFFTYIGTGVVCLPAFYLNEKVVPCLPPLVLLGGYEQREFRPAESLTVSMSLVATNPPKENEPIPGSIQLVPGLEYELFYWSDGWQSAGKNTAGTEPLVFDNVPSGCLYWLVTAGSDKEERIFSYDNGKQVWW